MLRCSLLIWVTTGKVAWAHGVEHVHEYPDMRKFENFRTALQASNLLGYREKQNPDLLFVRWSFKGSVSALEAKILKDGLDLSKLRKDWDDRKERFMKLFVPVEEIVERLSRFGSPEANIASWRKTMESTITSTKQ